MKGKGSQGEWLLGGSVVTSSKGWLRSNALVQLQARYNHCGEAASEKCLSAATFVR